MNIPNHVGIIMDGNGRWAEKQGKIRSYGHKKAIDNLEKLIEYIFSKGVKILSLYIFSTDNFKRDKKEVDFLMNEFLKFMKSDKFNKNEIKVVFSGRDVPLKEKVINSRNKIIFETKENKKAILNFCFNYGGQEEIIDAINKLIKDVNNGIITKEVDKEIFQKYLYNNLAPLDLVIRTSGEQRISNFMLWQSSYAEYYFPKTLFPDFNNIEFDLAVEEYNRRNRRFGGIKK